MFARSSTTRLSLGFKTCSFNFRSIFICICLFRLMTFFMHLSRRIWSKIRYKTSTAPAWNFGFPSSYHIKSHYHTQNFRHENRVRKYFVHGFERKARIIKSNHRFKTVHLSWLIVRYEFKTCTCTNNNPKCITGQLFWLRQRIFSRQELTELTLLSLHHHCLCGHTTAKFHSLKSYPRRRFAN